MLAFYKAPARGHLDQGVGIAGILVGDVFDEQQDEDVILVLAGIHTPAQLVAGFPEGGIEFGFFEGHEELGSPFDADGHSVRLYRMDGGGHRAI